MIKIGITGGIGAGKTTVARLLCEQNYPVYIADAEASRLINTDSSIRTAFIRIFGTSIYEQGLLNKKKLSDIIFQDKTALAQVNAIVHPCVLEDFNAWSKQQSASIVFFESAILFEAGLEKNFDFVICIYASQETRIHRVMKRDLISAEKVTERISNQMDDELKCKRSDFIINTDEGHHPEQQITEILKKIQFASSKNGRRS